MAIAGTPRTFRIWREDPGADAAPGFQEFRLSCSPLDRVLTVLVRIRAEIDGSLAFRHSCGHAICGSCGMTIQGRAELACRTLVRDLRGTVTVEPLRGFRVIRDLAVDMDAFFARFRRIDPYLVPAGEAAQDREGRQSPNEAARIAEAARCILCACCNADCPHCSHHPEALGPAVLLKAWRFVADSRDAATARRLDAVDGEDGVWRCHQVFDCLDACPKEIDIPAELARLKRAVLRKRGPRC